MPTVLIILPPPRAVPRLIITAHTGNTHSPALPPPIISISRVSTPANFCVSCAPCMNAITALEAIWDILKTPSLLSRSIPENAATVAFEVP